MVNKSLHSCLNGLKRHPSRKMAILFVHRAHGTSKQKHLKNVTIFLGKECQYTDIIFIYFSPTFVQKLELLLRFRLSRLACQFHLEF